MANNNVIPMYSKISLAELFLNMNRTQHEFNRDVKDCILKMNKKQKILQALVIALFLTTIMGFMAFGLAMHKFKTEPTTVYIQGESATVDLNDLPLAPLEEVK